MLIDLYSQPTSALTSVALVGFVIIGYGILQNASRGVVQLLAALVSFRYVNTSFEGVAPADNTSQSNVSSDAEDESNFIVKGLRFSYPDSAASVVGGC